MPNDRWHPPRSRPDPYGLWREGATLSATVAFWLLAVALSLALGFGIGWVAGAVMR